ncbi:hypothetical protein B0W48_06100 [Pseudoalteromonas aliena]|uniref:DUF4252 domain-containing protein n=1 Tax=Pseudoalteromonas aliena TaxID=247523 RepID=A0A1Q2GW93_9GAMM|nr:hypothetical protein [Pseudoalteromonas aliena]AQP99411.1 hypothetical protein B0W48_06100 [Pseudoalteromonas aliena]
MKLKHSLIFIALLSTTTVYATPVGANLAGAKEASANNACKFDIKFSSDPKQKQQLLNVAPNVDLKLKQFIATKVVKGARVASNVMCQQLIGQQYTGSQQEWQGFINNALQGLLNGGFKDLKLTKVGTNDAAYKGTLGNMEYIFTGDNSGNKQVIYNLAVLDKANNQVITISVSGNEKVTQEIQDEYQRLVNSFSL